MNKRNLVQIIAAAALAAIALIWLVPGLLRKPEDTADKPIPIPPAPSASARATSATPPLPAWKRPQIPTAPFKSHDGGGEPSPACASCESEKCQDEASPCDKVTGNATEGPAAGTSKADLCRETLACVRETNCAALRVLHCACSSADANECFAGKSQGPCWKTLERSLETTNPRDLLHRTSDRALGGGAALGLLMCDQEACTQECVPYYR